MMVNREQFIRQLEMVQPGLSPREIVEQSSCFVFSGGEIMTFNDEVSCRVKSPFLPKEFKGAVQSEPLLNVLKKMPEEEVSLEPRKEEFVVVGKRRRAGIRMEDKVTLPIDSVEAPKKWGKLHPDFGEAVGLVHRCAAWDASQILTCVHLHPEWVEASDNSQLCRWALKTGLSGPALVRQVAIKPIAHLGVIEFAESAGWVHFRNEEGLVYSCRRYVETYPDSSKLLDLEKSSKASLPKGLADAADKAAIFSSENENNMVLVELSPGKIRVRGQGMSGWYSESRKSDYKGKPMAFMVAPELLIDLVKSHSQCEVTDRRLRVKAGKYVYIACLSKPKTNHE